MKESQRSGDRQSGRSENKQNISGALVDGHLVNPVFMGAMGYQTSKFDKELESESE
jgi:hypothetical protein